MLPLVNQLENVKKSPKVSAFVTFCRLFRYGFQKVTGTVSEFSLYLDGPFANNEIRSIHKFRGIWGNEIIETIPSHLFL